jgi:imidazolonepropionase-like amidohydrolase
VAYLSASPWFYLYVVVLWLLVRRPGRVALATRMVAIAVGVAGVAAPIAASFAIDPVRLPVDRQPVSRIVNARVVDPVDGLLPGMRTVRIVDGAIADLGGHGGEPDDAGRTLDANGAYLVPGLIDVHAHLQTPTESIDSFSLSYAAGEIFGDYRRHRAEYLASGVTSVRDTGGAAAVSLHFRQALAKERLASPRVFTVARLITSPGGHPVGTIWSRNIAAAGAIQARDRASMLQAIDDDFSNFRPDALKVIYGTIDRARTRLSENLMRDAIAAAARHGVPSIVHAERTDEVWSAVRAGATGIEHIASMPDLPEGLLTELRERRPFVDPTFGEYRVLLVRNGRSRTQVEDALATSRAIVARVAAAGVPLVAGTDAPLVPFGHGLHGELHELEHVGLTAREILRIVTVNNAAYLGRASTLGRVARGFRADLILVPRNPLDSVDTLSHPLWTMVDGVVMWETPASTR